MMNINDKESAACYKLAEEVYFALQGESCEPIPGIENAFADGSVCDKCYSEMLDAYARLRDRLGARDEDEDVEIIISSLRRITDELCYRMFFYGAQLKSKEETA